MLPEPHWRKHHPDSYYCSCSEAEPASASRFGPDQSRTDTRFWHTSSSQPFSSVSLKKTKKRKWFYSSRARKAGLTLVLSAGAWTRRGVRTGARTGPLRSWRVKEEEAWSGADSVFFTMFQSWWRRSASCWESCVDDAFRWDRTLRAVPSFGSIYTSRSTSQPAAFITLTFNHFLSFICSGIKMFIQVITAAVKNLIYI